MTRNEDPRSGSFTRRPPGKGELLVNLSEEGESTMPGTDRNDGTRHVRREEEGREYAWAVPPPALPSETRWTPSPSAGMDMPVTTLLGVDLPSFLPSSRRNPLGLFPILARSTVGALAAFPELRDPEGRSNGELHLGLQLLFGGIAFSAVLKHADRRTPGDLTENLLELYERAGRGELLSKDRDGATFWVIDSPFSQEPISTVLLDGPVLGLSRPGGRRTRQAGSPRRVRSSSLSLTYESRWIRAGTATSFLSRVKKGMESREGLDRKHGATCSPPEATSVERELV